MNLSAPFIRRPVMTTLAMFALLITGLLAYRNLPISSMPNIAYPTVNVKVSFPGALPETMANSVALPLEKQFMAIPGLRLVVSNNTLGATSVILQFEVDKDMTEAAQDVQEAITAATPYLPPDLPFGPTYRKVNPAEQPIIYLSLTSQTMHRADLYTYGSTLIGQRISMIDGVSQVTAFGSLLAVRAQVDPAKLAAHDVTLTELADVIKQENAFLATGQLDGVTEAPIISVDGQIVTAIDYEPLIVAYRNGTPIRLRDLGKVVESFSNNKIAPQYVDKEGRQPTVTLAIQKEPDGNTVAIADAIYELLGTIKTELPPAIDLHVVFDRSIPVREAIHDAIQTLVIALILVVLVIFLFLGKFVDTIIPSIAMPLSVIATFVVMQGLHFTLDSLSVLALTLAIGFIIDDAVVVLENIVRRIEQGEKPFIAAMEGSKQICFTIVSMSLSLVAVFIPMLFMAGLIGKVFNEFAVTLTAVTIISGFISLTLTPMLASRFLPPRRPDGMRATKVSAWSDHVNDSMRSVYRRLLLAVLHHRIGAISIAFLCTVATAFFLSYIPTDFVPDEDLGFFIIYTQEGEGGSSFSMQEKENQLIEMLQANPAVDKVVAISSYSEYRKGLNLVRLKPLSERPPLQVVTQGIYADLQKIQGLQGFIKNVPLVDLATGQENRAAYQFALQSLFASKIYPSATRLQDKMRADPIFQGVNSDMEVNTPQVNVEILRDKASTLGLTADDIERTFSYSYSGNFVSKIQTTVDQYYVILELLPEMQKNVETLNQVWIRSPTTSELVPLMGVIDVKEGLGASSMNHINQFPSVIMSFNLAPGIPLETALDRLKQYTQEVVDSSVTATPIGAAQTFNESVKSSGYLLILTIFSIYIILGILYESFLHPLTILSTLPPATFGGLLTLLIFGFPLSLYSFLGVVLLIGIVKKNGIMLVDFAIENSRQRGMSPKDAIIDSCMVRFRPIMMTTVAAIFGVLPIALGIGANAAARRPLGIVIIGGLLFSQLVTLFITPIIYLAIERMKERSKQRFKISSV